MSRLSGSERRKVLTRDGWRCVKCDSVENLEVDHIIPTYADGTDELENLQTLCRSCHQNKTSEDAKNPEYNRRLRENIARGRGRKSKSARTRRWQITVVVIIVAIAVLGALAL